MNPATKIVALILAMPFSRLIKDSCAQKKIEIRSKDRFRCKKKYTSKCFAMCLKLYIGLEENKKDRESPLKKKEKKKKKKSSWIVADTFNPSLGRQSQADHCEFKGSLVYRISSSTEHFLQLYIVLFAF